MAAEGGMSFREVVQNQGNAFKWKDISISTGGNQKDFKSSELAGGYGYRDSGRVGSPARNRFIYWRTNQETLELVEVSLDFNLSGNAVRYHFQGAAILPGLSIYESHGNLFILVPTAFSVHRLVFPHPNKLQKYEHQYGGATLELKMASIFADASVGRAQDLTNCHTLTFSTPVAPSLTTAASWLSNDGEAIFAMATDSTSVILVKLPRADMTGIVTQHELKLSSMMQRLWTGLVPIMGRGGAGAAETVLSLVIHPLQSDTFVFTVCRDHKLRMWSTKNYECVMVCDLLEFLPDNQDPNSLVISGCGHKITKSVGASSQQVQLGVYLSFSDRSHFLVLQPVLADGRYQLHPVTTVFGARDNLIDYCLTPDYLWTLWKSSNEETICRVAPIAETVSGGALQWATVLMHEEDNDSEALQEAGADPQDAYLQHIFYPGRFSTHTLLKALSIYKRSLDTSHLSDAQIPVDALKAEVASVVQHEVEQLLQYDVEEEDVVEIQLSQWAKFYSCCLQYHQRGSKPLGIFGDIGTGMVSVVRRDGCSYVRATHATEHLYLTPSEQCLPEQLSAIPRIKEDSQLCRDVVSLCDCLKTVNGSLTDEMETYFEQTLYECTSPETVAKTIVDELLKNTSSHAGMSLARELELQMHSLRDVVTAADTLIMLLDVTQSLPDDDMDAMMEDDPAQDAGRQLSVSHLFSSSVAVNVVCETVQQLASSRLHMSRDLIITLVLLKQLGEQTGISLSVAERISSDLINKASLMVQAYFLMKWAAQVVVQHPSTQALEKNQQQLESLELFDMGASACLHSVAGENLKALELFLRGAGGVRVKELLSRQNVFDDDPCAVWNQALMPTAITVMQLIWPLCTEFVYPEFLLTHCQFGWLAEYVRLSDGWCEFNPAARRFMLGVSCINNGDAARSLDCLLEAVHGVSHDDVYRQEEFLLKLIRVEDDNVPPKHLHVLYYLKVLNLLEQHELPELAVSVATTAISIASADDPNLPTLWSKVFKQQLQLGNNEEAYNAMIANPDASRRKDCLRQFVVTLCERSQLQTLVELPYKERRVDLEDEVVNILESRARSIDLAKHNYYDLLYAFHVYRQNYRTAGRVMYEYGMRLGMEMQGLRGLQKQAKCYLAALNALRLVNPNNAWIIRPLATPGQDDEDMGGGDSAAPRSLKHTLDGEEIAVPSKRKVDILELEEIEKEYMLVHARLQLLQQHPEPNYMTGPTASADETIGLLVNAGLFDSAINICKMFKMPLTTVFEGLATRCVHLSENSQPYMQGDSEYTAEAWKWLQLNNLPPSNAGKESSSVDTAWQLLHSYLNKYEDKSSSYYRAVAIRLLSQDFSLPHWFVANYKRLNAAELLRLYLDYDLLEEAALLSLDFIDALLGRGYEYFGLNSFLHCNSPPVWLPYTSLDQLMAALKDAQAAEPLYEKLYGQMLQKMDQYFDVVEKVSQDTCEAKNQRASETERRERERRGFMNGFMQQQRTPDSNEFHQQASEMMQY